jgi:Flp pilus assembly protein TadD
MLTQKMQALADAEEAIRLAPAWPKGYSRKAAAHFFLKNYDEAHSAYSKALELAPNDELIGMREMHCVCSFPASSFFFWI